MTKPVTEERVAHTPTPWDTLVQVKTLVHVECRAENSPDFLKHICSIPKKDIANAEFIVTACNAHEALVSALTGAQIIVEGYLKICKTDDLPTAAAELCLMRMCAALSLATQVQK